MISRWGPGTLSRNRLALLAFLSTFGFLAAGDTAPNDRLVAVDLPLGWWKLDEGVGASSLNSGRAGHAGRFVGEPVWSAGLQGSGLGFDGVEARLWAGKPAHDRLARELTLTAWVQVFPRADEREPGPAILGRAGSFALGLSSASTRPELLLHLEKSGGGSREWVRCGSSESLDSGWHQVAATFTSGGARSQLFVDGVLAADCPIATPGALLVESQSPLELGGILGGSAPLNGVLDDVRLYDRMLSSEEIESLLWSPVEPSPPPPEEVVALLDESGRIEIRYSHGHDPEPAGVFIERIVGSSEADFQPVADIAGARGAFFDTTDSEEPVWYRIRAYGPGGFSESLYVTPSPATDSEETEGESDAERDGSDQELESIESAQADELQAQATVDEELALPKEVTLPSVSGIENSELTGSATASVPIQLPKLPASFPLGLSLSYSSEVANTIRSSIEAKGLKAYQLRTHSGVYGLGWSLSGIPGIAPGPGGPFADRKIPHLNLGGSFLIRYDPATKLLHTQPLSFDQIQINASPDGLSEDHFYWGKGGYDGDQDDQHADWFRRYTVRDRSGTRYTFGAQQRIYNCARSEKNRGSYAIGYHVTEIQDVHGNRAVFYYFREKTDNGKCRVDRLGENHAYDRGFFIRAIEFFPKGAASPTVRVDFESIKHRPDGFYFEQDQYRVTEEIGAPLYSKYRITAINVSVRLETGAYAVFRRYELDNNRAVMGNANIGGTDADESDYGHMLLKGVRILGRQIGRDAQGKPIHASFPSYRFTYSTDPSPAHPEWNYSRLAAVENGYGGRVVFHYTTVPMSCSGRPVRRFAVSKVQTFDGVEPGPASEVDYQYFSPECRVDQRDKKEPKSADAWFLGYEKVVRTERHPDAISGDVEVETDYHVSQQKHPFGLIPHAAAGRPHRVRVRSAGGVLQETTTSWAVKADTIVPPGFMGLDWLRKDSESQTTGGRIRLTQYVYSNITVWPFQFGLPDQVLSLGDPAEPKDDLTTRLTYLPPGAAQIIGLKSKEEVWGWDGVSESVAPRLLRETRFFYDKEDPDPAADWGRSAVLGNLTATLGVNPGGSPSQVQTNFYYDEWGNQRGVRDARGHRSSSVYDPVHHAFVIQSINAMQQSASRTYDFERGVVREEIDLNGNRTTYAYDDLGRVTEILRPGDVAGPTQRYEYSPIVNGQVKPPYAVQVFRRIDEGFSPSYIRGSYFYNGIGQKIQTQMPGDEPGQLVVANSDYGSQGKVLRSSQPYEAPDGSGAYSSPIFPDPTLYEYDALGRATKTTHPDQRVERVEYRGWDRIVVDALDRRREGIYDAFGRLLRSIEPENAATEYTYSSLGALTRVKDSAGNQIVLKYDLLGRKVEMTDPDMGRWVYEYDAAGNLVRQTDARGLSTTIEYDPLNRRERKTYSDPTAAPVTYVYDEGQDGVGQRTGMVDAGGVVAWSYDEKGRLRDESRLFTGAYAVLRSSRTPGEAYVTRFHHDAGDRIRTVTYPDGEEVTTEYSLRGLATSLTSSQNADLVRSARYDEQARPAEIELGNGRVAKYQYWAPSDQVLGIGQGGRLQQLEVDSAFFLTSYHYDAVGNVSSMGEASDTAGIQALEFAYDGLDRLIAASASSSHLTRIPGYQETYGYDPIGNLKMRNGQAYLYGLNGGGPHAVGSVGSDSYHYDQSGNMVQRIEDGTLYAQGFDAENRLKRVSAGEETTRFVYDGNGKRLLKVERSGSRESTTAYIADRYEESFDTTKVGLADAVAAPPVDAAAALDRLRESLELEPAAPPVELSVEIEEPASFVSTTSLDLAASAIEKVSPASNLQPLGWWKLDENGRDDGRAAHEARLGGEPKWIEGRHSSGLALDGTDDFLEIGNRPEYRLSRSLSIAAWVNVPARGPKSKPHPAILGKAKSYGLRLRSRTTRPELVLHMPDAKDASEYGYVSCAARDEIGAGWHHLAGTYGNKRMRLYVDGVPVEDCKLEMKNDGKGRITAGAAPLLVGRWTPNDANFQGMLDDVRLYDRVVSEEEVRGIFATAASVAPPAPPSSPRAAALSTSSLRVSWSLGAGQTSSGLVLERKDAASKGLYRFLAELEATDGVFVDEGLPAGSAHVYRLRAFGPGGFSRYSRAVTGTTDAEPGAPPPEPPLSWWKLDETAGVIARDEMGLHDGVVEGSPEWTLGEVGGGLALDGESGFVSVGDFPEYRINRAITMSGWVNVPARDPESKPHPAVLGKAKSYALRLRSRTTRPELVLHMPDAKDASEYGYVSCAAQEELGSGWHHLAGSYGDRRMRLYVDGVPVEDCKLEMKKDGKGRITTGSAPLLLGRWTPNDANFQGMLDDVRLYDRRLSDEEVFRLSLDDELGVECEGEPALELSLAAGPNPVLQGQETTFDNLGSREPLGGELTYTWRLDFGDGNAIGQNTPVTTLDGVFEAVGGSHAYIDPGLYAATYTVNVSSPRQVSCRVSREVKVTVSPHAPVAAEDLYRGLRNAPLNIPAPSGVLANDVDPDGDPLSVQMSRLPAQGTLTLNGADGSFTYVPQPGFVGVDSFSYKAFDGALVSLPTTVTLVVDVIHSEALLAHLRFDETAGSVASDSSGRAHHASIQNTRPALGLFAGAFGFDGKKSLAEDEDGGEYLNGLSSVTVTMWVKSEETGSDKGMLVTRAPNGKDRALGMRYARRGPVRGATHAIAASIETTGGVQRIESSSGLQTTFWQFVALRWTSGEPLALYVNGRLDTPSFNDPATTGAIVGAKTIRFGQGARDQNGSWKGLLDDVRIYGRALSDEEIALLFGAGADEVPPIVAGPELEPVGGDPSRVYVSQGSRSFFYGPSASGSLRVSLAASDEKSGLESVLFPNVFGAKDGTAIALQGERGPESFFHDYAIQGGTAVDGIFETVVQDRFGNETRGPGFRVLRDSTPPSAEMIVPDLAYGSILVSWEGDDGDGAGARSFDVEVRDAGTMAWTPWLSETTSSRSRYRGEPERSYFFRARATDRVGNIGAWKEGGPVHLRAVQLRKYYSLGGTRVAVRRDDELFYLVGDHLGSTSMVMDGDGAMESETRYLPYGDVRWESGESPTDFGFTGQRLEAGIGLMDFNARYYSSRLGAFISADTLVPDPGGSQGFNRYAYVQGNPMKFTDPSGNCHGLAGGMFDACATVVTSLATAVHKANEYREAIFFPDASTTFADRLEAAAVVGGGPVILTGAPMLAIKAVPYLYAGHASLTLATAAHPTAAAAVGGAAETAVECAMTGGGCTPGDYLMGAATAGMASRSQGSNILAKGVPIDAPEVPSTRPFIPEPDPLTTRPLAGYAPANTPGGRYPNPDVEYDFNRGNFHEYLTENASADLLRYKHDRRLGEAPSWNKAPQKVKKEFWKHFDDFHRRRE